MKTALDSQARAWPAVVITRRPFVYFLGALAGFVWLVQFFGPPAEFSHETASSPLLPYLRLLVPLGVLLLVRRPAARHLLAALLVQVPRGRLTPFTVRFGAVALALGLIPLFSGVLTGNVSFVISAVLPLTFSAATLLGIVLLDDDTLRCWLLGVTGTTAGFLVTGMVTTQMAATTYFGRPRVVMGFTHPTVTASAILGTLIFVLLLQQERLRRMPPRGRAALLGVYGAVVVVLMQLAQSRNQLISLCLAAACAWVFGRTGRPARSLIFAVLLLAPVLLYLFVLLGSSTDPFWATVNEISSGRLGFFQTVLFANFDLSDGRILFEAGSARQEAFTQLAGFAATDSVYLTFLINYGLFALLAFVALLLMLGLRLAQDARDAVALGALCGLVLLFSLDAAGITTSNLVIFVCLACAVRAGVFSGQRPPSAGPEFPMPN